MDNFFSGISDAQAEPDEELKPYIEFLEEYGDITCDNQGYDSDECEAQSTLYDFSFAMSHVNGNIRLLAIARPEKRLHYKSIRELEESYSSYNRKHSTSISCHHTTEKKWLFSSPTYKVDFFALRIVWPLQKDSDLISNFFMTFYKDLHSFFSEKWGAVEMPLANFEEENSENFLSYLRDEALMFELYKILKNTDPISP